MFFSWVKVIVQISFLLLGCNDGQTRHNRLTMLRISSQRASWLVFGIVFHFTLKVLVVGPTRYIYNIKYIWINGDAFSEWIFWARLRRHNGNTYYWLRAHKEACISNVWANTRAWHVEDSSRTTAWPRSFDVEEKAKMRRSATLSSGRVASLASGAKFNYDR